MTPPSFAVMLRGQQSLNLFFISVRTLVIQKGVNLRDRRRKADQIETQTAQQRHTVGFRRSRQTFFLQPRENEPINRSSDPALAFDFGQWRAGRFNIRPVSHNCGAIFLLVSPSPLLPFFLRPFGALINFRSLTCVRRGGGCWRPLLKPGHQCAKNNYYSQREFPVLHAQPRSCVRDLIAWKKIREFGVTKYNFHSRL